MNVVVIGGGVVGIACAWYLACTPDGLPFVGRPRALDNLVIATGHAMIGVSLGPVTGKLVAEIVAGEKPLMDLAPLSPDRFGQREGAPRGG